MYGPTTSRTTWLVPSDLYVYSTYDSLSLQNSRESESARWSLKLIQGIAHQSQSIQLLSHGLGLQNFLPFLTMLIEW